MGTSDVQLAVDKIAAKLEELGIPYAICGGLAVTAHGHARTTVDVDVLVTAEGLERFKQEAIGHGWLDRFPGSRGVRDTERRVPIDFLVAGGNPGDGQPRAVRFPDPAAASEVLGGRRYLTLPRLIELKLASGMTAPDRLQDFADVIHLIRARGLAEGFAVQLDPEVRDKYRELLGHAQRPTG